jgi:predicted nucleic acid-binding protein
MLYWDSSALVASFISEQETSKVRSFSIQAGKLRSYTAIITPLEVESAIQRRLKEKSLSIKQADETRLLISEFRKQAYLVIADQNILDIALHIQKIYYLRVADALQLASARAGTESPSKVHFLCLDEKLNEAAKREGFIVSF